MPNPDDAPLDQFLNYGSHVTIRCSSPKRCGHQITITTAELYRRCRGAVTCADFRRRLVCKRCGQKGYAGFIKPGRG